MTKGTIVERADQRYELAGNQIIPVTIVSDEHRVDPITVDAQLLNLSSTGAKLALPIDLPRDRWLRLKLTLEEFALTIYVSGKVCWKSNGGEQSCQVGCRLNPQIPTSILQHVAQSGRLDRRDEDRRPVQRPVAIVRRRGLRTVEEPADLHNYADGGVCLSASQPAELGERLTLRLDGGPKFEVVVRWQMQQGDQCLIGCEYVDAKVFDALKAALEV
jgi:hypothetical protein